MSGDLVIWQKRLERRWAPLLREVAGQWSGSVTLIHEEEPANAQEAAELFEGCRLVPGGVESAGNHSAGEWHLVLWPLHESWSRRCVDKVQASLGHRGRVIGYLEQRPGAMVGATGRWLHEVSALLITGGAAGVQRVQRAVPDTLPVGVLGPCPATIPAPRSPRDPRHIVSIGSSAGPSRLFTVLRAMAGLPEHSLTIARPGRQRRRIEGYLRRRPELAARVRVLDELDDRACQRLLAMAGVFAYPSRTADIASADLLISALRLGTALALDHRVGGYAGLISAEGVAILSHPRGWADGIRRVSDEIAAHPERSLELQDWADEHYSPRAVAHRLIDTVLTA